MSSRSSRWLLALLLVAITLIAFEGVRHAGFLNYDDNDYITANPAVSEGLSAESIGWAFTRTHSSNWHPLTWIAHMVDASIFGTDPGSAAGHHLSNLFVHLLAALMLFALLLRLECLPFVAFWIAALFAVHPMHTESVAWVSERKDTLSALFGFASLYAYVGWARTGQRRNYAGALVLFAAGLMSKSMLVTWPGVMLVLDAWPLRREEPWSRRLIEKIPFVALVVASVAATLLAQSRGGALRNADLLAPGDRLVNAFLAAAGYLGKLAWPVDMAIFYPHWALADGLPRPGLVQWGGAILLLLAITIAVIHLARRRGAAAPLVGWLLYLGTLVPVIGLIQVGPQRMADRYTYLPAIGIFVIAAAGLGWLARRSAWAQRVAQGIGVLVLLGCVLTTRAQVGHWRDSGTLFTHALAVTDENWIAHLNVGEFLRESGDDAGALHHYRESLRIKPDDPMALYNLANVLVETGDVEGGIETYRKALRRNPANSAAQNNLGNALATLGRFDEAAEAFARALALDPGLDAALANRAWSLLLAGRANDAAPVFAELVVRRPNEVRAWRGYAEALVMEDAAGALRAARRAVELSSGEDPESLEIAARALGALGEETTAVETLTRARELFAQRGAVEAVTRIDRLLRRIEAGPPPRTP